MAAWRYGFNLLEPCVENISHSFVSLTRKYKISKIKSVSPHSHVKSSIFYMKQTLSVPKYYSAYYRKQTDKKKKKYVINNKIIKKMKELETLRFEI